MRAALFVLDQLFPAGLPVAFLALARVRFFPHSDRTAFVLVHLFVHAHAIGTDDLRCGASLAPIVGDTLIDPLDVVGIHLLRMCRPAKDAGQQEGR